jgi:hypothetical protein
VEGDRSSDIPIEGEERERGGERKGGGTTFTNKQIRETFGITCLWSGWVIPVKILKKANQKASRKGVNEKTIHSS